MKVVYIQVARRFFCSGEKHTIKLCVASYLRSGFWRLGIGMKWRGSSQWNVVWKAALSLKTSSFSFFCRGELNLKLWRTLFLFTFLWFVLCRELYSTQSGEQPGSRTGVFSFISIFLCRRYCQICQMWNCQVSRGDWGLWSIHCCSRRQKEQTRYDCVGTVWCMFNPFTSMLICSN